MSSTNNLVSDASEMVHPLGTNTKNNWELPQLPHAIILCCKLLVVNKNILRVASFASAWLHSHGPGQADIVTIFRTGVANYGYGRAFPFRTTALPKIDTAVRNLRLYFIVLSGKSEHGAIVTMVSGGDEHLVR